MRRLSEDCIRKRERAYLATTLILSGMPAELCHWVASPMTEHSLFMVGSPNVCLPTRNRMFSAWIVSMAGPVWRWRIGLSRGTLE